MKFLSTLLFFLSLKACTYPSSTPCSPTKPLPAGKISQPPSSITRAVVKGSQGLLWIASWEGILQYDGTTFRNITQEITAERFFTLLEDKQGKWWMGSVGGGLYAYDGQQWEHWTTQEGLVNDRVLCLYEDSKGNIWIGTEGGLSCYNGVDFKNFTTAEGLPHSEVNALVEVAGKLWIGTKGAACQYDGQQFKLLARRNSSQLLALEQEASFENVRALLKDNTGRIWLAGQDGLWVWKEDIFQLLSKQFTTYLYLDSTEKIWMTAQNPATSNWELSYYEIGHLKQTTPTPVLVKSTPNMLFGMAKDTAGKLWVGHLNGIYQCDELSFDCY